MKDLSLNFLKNLVMMIIWNLKEILDIPDTELFDIILKKKILANLKNSILIKILNFCNGEYS